jgi:hypothetical protein
VPYLAPIVPTEQEKKELAITSDLVDFVQNVTDHPSTFTNFPVETEKGPQPASTHFLSHFLASSPLSSCRGERAPASRTGP